MTVIKYEEEKDTRSDIAVIIYNIFESSKMQYCKNR